MATSLPPIVLEVETAVGPAEAWAAVDLGRSSRAPADGRGSPPAGTRLLD
ncbi:MAG: hypothetical protein ACXWXR_00895 [Candidatus Limnocylindrales bacterium]